MQWTLDLRWILAIQNPVASSHSRTVLLLPEASSSRPSGAVPNATETTTPIGVAGKRLAEWGAGDRVPQRTVPSSPPEASSSRPSGPAPNATEATGPPWPVTRLTHRGAGDRVPQPHRPVRLAAEASSGRPSGPVPNATEVTGPGAGHERLADRGAGGGSHSRTSPSLAAGGQQQPPVRPGPERHRGHLIVVAGERLPHPSAR